MKYYSCLLKEHSRSVFPEGNFANNLEVNKMTNSINIVAPVAVLIIVDLERTTAEEAQAALEERLTHVDSDASHLTYEYHTTSLRDDGLGERLQAIVEGCKERGLREAMVVLAGAIDGESFQKPIHTHELEEAITQYAMALQIEELVGSLGGRD